MSNPSTTVHADQAMNMVGYIRVSTDKQDITPRCSAASWNAKPNAWATTW